MRYSNRFRSDERGARRLGARTAGAAVLVASIAGGLLASVPAAEATVVAIPPAAVVHTAAVLVAPAPSTRDGHPDIAVGLQTQNDAGARVSLSLRRGSGPAYEAEAEGESQGISEAMGGPASGVRTGDRVEVLLAVSQLAPARGTSIGAVIAIRVRDLRTGRTLISLGRSTLLTGGPRVPDLDGAGDVAVTVATWGRTWTGTGATLDNRRVGGTMTGVSQWGRDFFVTDRAHPRRGVPVGTTRLRARLGDQVAVRATTAATGSHTDVVIVDRRNSHRVHAAC